jgi:hypothetical protein
MSSYQGSSRKKQRRWKSKNHAVGQEFAAAIYPEHRSNTHQDISQFTRQQADTNARRHLAYAAAAAMGKDQPIYVYKPATFYTVERDNAYPYPLEDIPHLMVTCRYLGATMPKN